MSKKEMQRQISYLRNQMAKLEKSCKEREDKIVDLLLKLEPFLNAIPSCKIDEIFKDLEN